MIRNKDVAASQSANPSYAGHALNGYREPLFIIDQHKNVLFRNAAAAQVLRGRGGLSESGGRLQLGAAKADDVLRELVAGKSRTAVETHAVRGIRVGREKCTQDWLLLVHPLVGSDLTASQIFFVQVLGRTRGRSPPRLALRDLFGLTAREFTVVASLLRTGSIARTAVALGLARETIRTYLKRVFRKCEVHSKAELFCLLNWICDFPGVAPSPIWRSSSSR